MSDIAVIGTGYVGLVGGACLSEFGMNVICVDKDIDKINGLKMGIIPIYEPGIEAIIKKNQASGRLKFTVDIKYAVESSEVIFLAVGTPPLEDGSADLQYILAAAMEIGENINDYKVIVDKSTVPVGTGQKVKNVIKEAIKKRNANFEFDVVSNPEFLREGAAIRDFMHPDRIIIGAESERAIDSMKSIYNVLYLIDTPFVVTNLETAEMIKYASNAFLATKISFMNEIANLSELVGADVHHVAKAMGLDGRIGNKFLHPGPGYGGSCFPKDSMALAKIADDVGYDFEIIKSVVRVNKNQKSRMVAKIERHLKGLEGKQVGILGLSFKPETDDLREAPSITIIRELLDKGSKVKVYDPVAMENMKKLYGFNIEYCCDEYEACTDSDCVVLLTEWNQFRRLNLDKIKDMLKNPVFLDLRNVYEPEEMNKRGFIYEGVGRK
jgi:UDPglucose 6-dehydrogenase